MLVSYNWLKEYVDIDLSAEALAEMITRAGVEIGGISYCAEGISNVVIAEVVTCKDHPDSDHLHLCEVTTDGTNRIQVVCGAPNVAAGQRVCFAQVGATLPGGMVITAATLRGVASNGMICSMQELGVSDELVAPADKDGIRVLPADAPLGEDVVTYLGLDDYVYDVDLTPNRSDCLSVYNVAREVGALLEKPVRPLDVTYEAVGAPASDDMTVTLAAPDLCQRYVGALVRDVADTRSPIWMEHRLQCAGMRPISFLVDVTNYVMLETGQPLHAFDYGEIAGHHITVRRAHKDETIVTLDDRERDLNEDMLLITDDDRAVGIAGIMGGENTEIRPQTKDVFIESAWFEPRNIRRSSLALGLRTEASIRNEKRLNIDGTVVAAERAAALIARYADGKVAPQMIDEYPVAHEPVEVTLRFAACNALLGTDIEPAFMVHVLERLQFVVSKQDEQSVTVTVPGWRPDVTIEEDLIEEVARIYGYDNIPSTLPYGASHAGVLTARQRLRRHVRDRLASRGLHEVLNYSFTRPQVLDNLMFPENDPHRTVIPIDNPLSEELSIMRTEMMSGLLDDIETNQRHDVYNIAIFETGAVFLGGEPVDSDKLVEEDERLAIALAGGSVPHWQTGRKAYDFYYLKGLVDDLAASLFLPPLVWKPVADAPGWHPGRTAEVWLGEDRLGLVGELHPTVLKAWDIRGAVCAAELRLEPIYAAGIQIIDAAAPARFPAMERDLAFVVKNDVNHGTLLDTIRTAAGPLLRSVALFDVYHGEQVGEDEKSLGFKLRFQSDAETLTDAVVDAQVDAVVAACADACGAYLRK